MADHEAGPSRAWRCTPLANLEVSVKECRDTCIVGIAIISAYATAAPEFVPDKREVHLLRVNPPRCSVATVSETPSPVWVRMVVSI